MTQTKVSAKPAKAAAAKSTKSAKVFTDEEKAAMKERAKELKAEARAGKDKAAGEADLLAKIADLPEHERGMATRLHAIITAHAPGLVPKTWYGMPAYARDGKIFCFFQSAQKFKTRYSTLGFSDEAQLDSGNFWPVAYALKDLQASEEAQIIALLKQGLK